MKKIMVTFAVVSIYLLLLTGFICTPSQAETTVFPFEQQMTLSDPCAVFNVSTPDPNVTRIVYGETIPFDLKGTIQAILDVSSDGNVNLKFMINTHGAGIGETSGIKYQFKSKALVKANTNGADPLDPNFVFNGKFKVDARIIGQGNDASAGGIAQGAQDNALLHFYIAVRYANGEIQPAASDFALECVASPWTNQMSSPEAGDKTKTPVGRGFGDPWNKYSWSMKDFNGGMVVGTKNAYFDYNALLTPSTDVQTCIAAYPLPSIYSGLACLELYEAGTSAKTDYAEIWRFDYVKKNWTKVFDDGASQGFRIMETHNGKLYAGSDLGSFVTGVDLLGGPPWNFPGSQILRSTDGKYFEAVTSCKDSGPCDSASGVANPLAVDVNVSIRALASFNDKLYVGTFNFTGGELWSYDDTSDTWALVHKFGPTKPAVTELRVFDSKLYIGLGGVPGSDYLWSYDDSTNPPAAVLDQPLITSPTNIGVLKLFVSSNDLLYIGLVDLGIGFKLLSYDYDNDTGSFETITENGFYNNNNAYAWSMAEINGRVFVGTFNQDFFTELPRGSAELWYSDDGTNWQQMALPLDWGLWNYGIRTMEVGDKQLFLGTASNMVAPDLISTPVPLSPGTEVWTIRTFAVAPTGKSGK